MHITFSFSPSLCLPPIISCKTCCLPLTGITAAQVIHQTSTLCQQLLKWYKEILIWHSHQKDTKKKSQLSAWVINHRKSQWAFQYLPRLVWKSQEDRKIAWLQMAGKYIFQYSNAYSTAILRDHSHVENTFWYYKYSLRHKIFYLNKSNKDIIVYHPLLRYIWAFL